MKGDNKKIVLATALSLLLHLLLILILYLSVVPVEINVPKEEVIEVDFNQKEWKIADILPPKVEEVPDKAEHIGLYNTKIQEETVAASTPPAPGRPVSRGGKGAEGINKEVEKSFEGTHERITIPEEKKTEAGFGMRAIPEDFYPDYKRGEHTYINVLKHPDVVYFVMLKRVFKLAWDPTQVLIKRRMTGEISRGSIKVVLGLAVDAQGEIDELFVFNSSGMGDYDNEAIRAVRASAPFSRPPQKLLSKDKILRISWSFVVYM